MQIAVALPKVRTCSLVLLSRARQAVVVSSSQTLHSFPFSYRFRIEHHRNIMLRVKPTPLEGIYPPLPPDPTKRQIRLLHLHRRGLVSEIHANLKVVSLDDEPKYDALSYTWGASTKGHTILLNGRFRLNITDNLHNALNRFRRRSEQPMLWVDAVCIDQSNIAERSEQVAMMGDIYRRATRVSVWLGEPSTFYLSQWYRVLVKLKFHDWHYVAVRHPIRTVRELQWMRQELALKDADAVTWPKWYHRAWTRQEYALARAKLFWFGSHWLRSTDEMLFAVEGLRERKQETTWVTFSPNISDALCNGKNLVQATDPRDLVYSVLGMIKQEDGFAIDPDYTRPWQSVFAQATFACIQADGKRTGNDRFRVLERFGRPRNSDTSSLPSWTVDLRYVTELMPVLAKVELPWKRQLKAPIASREDSFMSLRIEGVLFDVAASVSTVNMLAKTAAFDTADDELATDEWIAQLFRDLHRFSFNEFERQKSLETAYDVYSLCVQILEAWDTQASPFSDSERAENSSFIRYALRACMVDSTDRLRNPNVLAITVTGGDYLGFAPIGLKPGDSLVLTMGAKLPFILRPAGDSWTFHGFAWIHGIQNGELMKRWKDVELEYKTYKIV